LLLLTQLEVGYRLSIGTEGGGV